jgi:branched-chain amino acid transport system substrate-binding protein
MRSVRHRFMVLSLAVISTVAVACSNEETSEGARTATSAPGADRFAGLRRVAEPDPCRLDPGVTDTEIKVGGLVPESGPRAISFQPSEEGIRARFAKANQDRELGNRTLVFRPLDDGSDAARNREVARQLVESEKVFGIIEMSDQADGSAQYLNEQGIPVVGWHVGRPVWSVYENMFAFRAPASAEPEKEYNTRNALLIKEYGGTNVALVGGGNQSSVLFMNRVEKVIDASDGLEVVYKTTDVVAGTTEFTAIVQRIKESGADSLITGMDFTQNTALSDQLEKAGVDLKVVIFPGGYDSRVLSIPGVEGALFGLEFKPFELRTPSYQEFDRAMPPGAVRNQVTYAGWLSAHLFIEGIKQAGVRCPTREAFITNLRLLKDYTANGAFDPVDFTDVFGKEFECVYYVKVENGAFVPQFEGKQFCGEDFKF